MLLLCFCSATKVARAKTAGPIFVNVDQVDVDVFLKRGFQGNVFDVAGKPPSLDVFFVVRPRHSLLALDDVFVVVMCCSTASRDLLMWLLLLSVDGGAIVESEERVTRPNDVLRCLL